jgi:hypothetical protein
VAVVVFAEALAKVTWISEQHLLCIVGVVEAMVKDLVLEALALEIARIANHWLVVVPGAVAELQLPIWAITIGESGNSKISRKKIYNPYRRAGGLIRDQRRGHGIC